MKPPLFKKQLNCVPRQILLIIYVYERATQSQGFFLADWEELEESLKDLAQRNKVINVEKRLLLCVRLLMVKLTYLINVILLSGRSGLLNMIKQFLFVPAYPQQEYQK